MSASPVSVPTSVLPRRLAIARHLRTQRGQAAAAFALYLIFALAIMWPWPTDPGDILFGVVGGDQTSGVAMFGQFADEPQIPWLPGTIDQLNAPEGYEHNWSLHVASFGSSTVLFVLSAVLGPIAAHGLIALSGFVLSAFAMFLLVRRVTGSAPAALVSGLAFGFWPHMYGTGWTWPHYISLWVFVVMAWRMLVLAERPTTRNALWAGAAALFAMTWIEYHLLIGGVMFATLAVAVLGAWALSGRLREGVRALAITSALVAVGSGLVLAAALSADFAGLPSRTADDAVTRSARPLMYVVPGPQHPVLGGSAGEWIREKYTGKPVGQSPTASYANIYLTLPIIVLGFAGAVLTARRLLRRRRRGAPAADGEHPRETAIGAGALLLGAVAFAFSAPPKVAIAGLTIPMPYTFVNEITPVFRVASRFSTIVMLCACVLAGIALAALLRRVRGTTAVAAVGAIMLFLAVDGYARQHPGTTRVTPPPIYEELARQPKGIVAEFPLPQPDLALNTVSLYQDFHGHRLFQAWGTGDARSASRKEPTQFLKTPDAARQLAGFGVDYAVVFDPGPTAAEWQPQPGDRLPGLEQIAQVGNGALYRVTAKPPEVNVLPLEGWHGAEGEPPGFIRWTAANPAKIEVISRCEDCDGTVTFEASPFAQPRDLTVTDASGKVLLRERITETGQRVRVPVRLSRRTVLSLSTNPGPQKISDVSPGSPDTRAVAIAVARLTAHVRSR